LHVYIANTDTCQDHLITGVLNLAYLLNT